MTWLFANGNTPCRCWSRDATAYKLEPVKGIVKPPFSPGKAYGRGNQARVVEERPSPAERRAPMTWAQRLKRVFNIVIETCSVCGGAMTVIACIEDPVVIKQILDHVEHKAEASEPRALPESRAPPVGLQSGLFD